MIYTMQERFRFVLLMLMLSAAIGNRSKSRFIYGVLSRPLKGFR